MGFIAVHSSAFCPILNNAVQSSEEGDDACSCYIALKHIELYSITELYIRGVFLMVSYKTGKTIVTSEKMLFHSKALNCKGELLVF